jgi:hypothetical protein
LLNYGTRFVSRHSLWLTAASETPSAVLMHVHIMPGSYCSSGSCYFWLHWWKQGEPDTHMVNNHCSWQMTKLFISPITPTTDCTPFYACIRPLESQLLHLCRWWTLTEDGM